jgi:hypothetical protein
MDHKKSTVKRAKALAEFRFRRLGFFLWNQATMMRFRYVKYCTLSEVWDYRRNKADWGVHRAEKGRNARVALCTHPTHTDRHI